MYENFTDKQLEREKVIYLAKIEKSKDEIIKIIDEQNRRLKT